MKYFKTQDPKYDICVDDSGDHVQSYLVNSTTKKPIPANEPIMIFRAQDLHAHTLISEYRNRCADKNHRIAASYSLKRFTDFAINHPELLREPDTDLSMFNRFNKPQ